MNREFLLIFLCAVLTGFWSCKSKQKAEGFPSGEAFSNSYIDSQLVELKRELTGAHIERTSNGIQVTFASGILFPVNTAELSPGAQAHIGKLAGVLNKYPRTNIMVEGHTDITGTTEYNLSLSEKRAASVENYAVSLGVDPGRISTKGYGESRPVATNSTKRGQEKNRRVEIFIVP